MWFGELPVNVDCCWSGLRFICRFGSFLKVVAVNKVANVTMVEFVCFKVALRIEFVNVANYWLFWSCSLNWSSKVAEFIHDEFEKRPFDFDVMWWNFENWCVSSYINWLFHLILSIALLFELLMYWWRNQLVEWDWYKIFLCGFEAFECFEELFFVDALFDVFNVNALLKIC